MPIGHAGKCCARRLHGVLVDVNDAVEVRAPPRLVKVPCRIASWPGWRHRCPSSTRDRAMDATITRRFFVRRLEVAVLDESNSVRKEMVDRRPRRASKMPYPSMARLMSSTMFGARTLGTMLGIRKIIVIFSCMFQVFHITFLFILFERVLERLNLLNMLMLVQNVWRQYFLRAISSKRVLSMHV